jgi:hypothetical protein
MKNIITFVTVFVICMLLTGCVTDSGLIPPDTLYPDALTTCAPDPAVPPRPADGSPRSDKDKATYMSQLHTAGQDCRDTVAETAQRKRLYQQQFDAQTKDFVERSVDTVKSVMPF